MLVHLPYPICQHLTECPLDTFKVKTDGLFLGAVLGRHVADQYAYSDHKVNAEDNPQQPGRYRSPDAGYISGIHHFTFQQ
jgi:hypothetical protein